MVEDQRLDTFPYLVYGGYKFYPRGGHKDLIGSAHTVDEGIKFALEYPDLKGLELCMWWHIVDTRTGKIVKDSDYA